jgi:aminodeoxyfutalosine deaminase
LYRKIKADKIFTGKQMLSGHVLITEANGTIKEIVREDVAGDGVEVYHGVISPGFINCHCHLDLSYLKDKIPTSTGLVRFVQEVLARRGGLASEENANAMAVACDQMYTDGINAVADICSKEFSARAKADGRMEWINFIEISGFVNSTAQKRFSEAQDVLKYFNEELPGQRSMICPHAPYSVSAELFKLLNKTSKGGLISIHNQECIDENELFLSKKGGFLQLYENMGIDISDFDPSGRSSLQSWLPYFEDQRIISVHNTCTSLDDIMYVKQNAKGSFYYCICIQANLYIENALPPVEILVRENCNIVLGTDSYASNQSLSIVEEMKTIRKHIANISIETLLTWATWNGANALGIADRFGSFENGKKPGVILLEMKDDELENMSVKRLL